MSDLPEAVHRIIDNAVNEVMSVYEECDFTFEGVVEVGAWLQSLGHLVGRDLAQEAALMASTDEGA